MSNEIERMSAADFQTWVRDRRGAEYYHKKTALRERAAAIVKVAELKKQIAELKQTIKKPLPKKHPITKELYNQYVEQTKKTAKERGWLWIEPQEIA
jgi:hypothetical protein